ncbi:uncharacterized protein Snp isoform X2 [Dermacentor albipictus]|uniref:uncharacterized protein Snp isoform X2 n=1 Tax=Dermacentor albipictus TaxID=60249 RepID=UPI0031FD19EA
MALRCAATRYASLLFSKTVHAAPRSGGSRYLLPERQMSRLASPTYLSACATLPQQAFDYFLLLDFEATCSAEKGVPTPQLHQMVLASPAAAAPAMWGKEKERTRKLVLHILGATEIIEFPVLKVNGRTFETEATFHTYVQPQAHPQLTAFCIELTGIVQDMVDGQPHLQQVLSQFDVWMREQGLLQARTVFVTFGDWDLQKMHSQIARVTGPRPSWMHCTSVGCLIWDATTAASMTAATWRSWSDGWHPVATGLREPVFEEAELSQEAAVGHDLSPCAHQSHSLTGTQPPAQHEEGKHQRRRAADPLVTVNEHAAPRLGQRTLDEVGCLIEEAVEPEHGHVQRLDA